MKKWKMLSKEDVKTGIQFMILTYMTVWGFAFSYLLIWFKCGLPQQWWAILICTLSGMLSTAGLYIWITRN